MAKLVRLEVCGIRSFAPTNEQTIKFSSPLTIIVGQNGCGKTTIIESLLFASTGNFPAGSDKNGAGFINDPKISNSSNFSIKAFVKLTFMDAKKNEVTIHRAVELQILKEQKTKVSSKTPAIKITDATGREISVSSRCLSINDELSRMLNVGQTLLEYVIFCHQENSEWPLDARQMLKAKFDLIFETDKLNNCVNIVKKYLKDLNAALKVTSTDVKGKRILKLRVEEEQRRLTQKKRDIQSKLQDIVKKVGEKEPIVKEIERIINLERSLNKLLASLSAKEATKRSLVDQQKNILKNIGSDFTGSDEELQLKIDNFGLEKQKELKKRDELKATAESLLGIGKTIELGINNDQQRLSKYQIQITDQKMKCQERYELLKLIKRVMGLTSPVEPNATQQSPRLVAEIHEYVKTCETELDSLIKKVESESKRLQVKVDQARENHITNKQQNETKRHLITEREGTLHKITSELSKVSTIDSEYAAVLSKLENIDKVLASINEKFNAERETEEIAEMQAEIGKKEQQLEKNERDHRVLQQNDKVSGTLESEKKTIVQKTKTINLIRAKHLKALKELFQDVPEQRLKHLVLVIQEREKTNVRKFAEEVGKMEKEINRMEFEKNGLGQQLSAAEQSLMEKEAKIGEVCEGKGFEDVLESVQERKENLQRDKGQYKSIKVIYGNYLKEFEKIKPCCPVCETNFNSQSGQVSQILTNLRSKLQNVPALLRKTELEIEKVEELYDSLQQLKPICEEVVLLKNVQIPNLKDQLTESDCNLRTKTKELNVLKDKLAKPEKLVEICANILPDVTSIDQNQIDIEAARKQVNSLQAQIVTVTSNKSKFEIEAEIDDLKSTISELRRKIETKRAQMNKHHERVRKIMEEKNSYQQRQAQMRELVLRRPILEEQKGQLNAEIEKLNEELFELAATASITELELKEASSKKQVHDEENKTLIEQSRTKLHNCKQQIAAFDKINQEIKAYVDQKFEEKQAECEKQLAEKRSKLEKLQEKVEQIRQAIAAQQERFAKEEIIIRNLSETVLFREKKAEEVAIDAVIENLNKQIGDFDHKSIQAERVRLQEERDRLEMGINLIKGQKGAIEEEVQNLQARLKEPENRDAYKQYMHALYAFTTDDCMSRALTRFIPKLEFAVVTFHQFKMSQINKKIRELWRLIYSGNDIDHIEIKTMTTTKGYDYKVVQVKQGVEMDIRGRCSAGQRVLACLIIRIALAEALSGHCGILALDEPTTNLDKENAASLCEALAKIVQMRAEEVNFQLIVITHDEQFIRMLNRTLGTDSCYRVSRNPRGFSLITKDHLN